MEGWIKSKKSLHVRKPVSAPELIASYVDPWAHSHIFVFESFLATFHSDITFYAENQALSLALWILFSARCVATLHRTKWEEQTQEVNPRRRNWSPGFLLSGDIGRNTHVQLNHRGGVLRIAGVCLSVEMYANFKPYAHTAHIHNSHMPHTIRLVFDDY